MATKEQILASADRAATRKLLEVERAAEQAMFKSNSEGRLNSGAHLKTEYRICLDGYREICDAAVILVAEVEGAQAVHFAQELRTPLLSHQLAVDKLFKDCGAPGNSPIIKEFERLRPAFQSDLDKVLEAVLDDLSIGIAGGVNVKSRKSVGVNVELGGGAAQVIVDSPGASQHVGGDLLGRQGIDRAELLGLFSLLRKDIAAANGSERDKELAEDAIVNAERELAAEAPDVPRIKRLVNGVAEVAGKIGISAAGGVLGRVAQILAGMG